MSSVTELITIRELLRDPQYKKYFCSVPNLPEHYTPELKPWKLMIVRPGESVWRTQRFGTYPEAFGALKRLLPKISNAAINNPALGFMPPIRTVRLKNRIDPKTKKQMLKSMVWTAPITADMPHHDWCPHCRRPSIFRRAVLNRPARRGYYFAPGEAAVRCVICGVSDRTVNLRDPLTNQAWDVDRPKVYNLDVK